MEKTTRVCAHCSASFESSHPRALCCSRDCTTRRNRRIQNAKRYVAREPILCAQCGKTFEPPRSDSRHCSSMCRNKDDWRLLRISNPPTRYALTCGFCKCEFQSKYKKTRCCSDSCRKRLSYDRNAEDRRAYSRRWNAQNSNTEKYRLAQQVKYNNRRAAKLDNPDSIGVSIVEWLRLLKRYDYACAYCRTRSGRLTQDHVVPLSRGGRHAPANCVPACQSCNFSKGGKLLIEWTVRRRLLATA